MSGSDNQEITKAASIVGSATMLSRIFGYVRDAAIAAIFGASIDTDIFFVAYRIPNFFRRLLGEGAFTASIIPVLTDELSSGGKDRGRTIASKVITAASLVFLSLSIMGILFAGPLVKWLAPGFTDTAAKLSLATSMTRWTFPFLFFIGLLAVSMGILNSMKHFMAPALSPVFFNIFIILSVIILTPYFDTPVYALAVGVVGGGCMQFLFQLPYLKRVGMLPRLDFRFSDPAVKKIARLLGPYTLGVAVYQINILITQWFASRLPDGSISYLYYANRLVELPIGIFGVAIATAVLPSMSDYAAKKEWKQFRETFSFAIRMINFITIPATIGLMILGPSIISLLFRRGAFSEFAVHETTYALYFYSLGIFTFSGTKISASAFYSLKDTVTPVLVALLSVATNIIMSTVLVTPFKHGGLALSISIASAVNFLALVTVLRLKMGRMDGRLILTSIVKVSMASIVMGICVYGINHMGTTYGGGVIMEAIFLFLSLLSGLGVFFLLAYILKINELNTIVDLFLQKPASFVKKLRQ